MQQCEYSSITYCGIDIISTHGSPVPVGPAVYSSSTVTVTTAGAERLLSSPLSQLQQWELVSRRRTAVLLCTALLTSKNRALVRGSHGILV